jgi:hypothetical protein
MIRQGVFGEPMHSYTGYQKEVMYYSFNADGTLTFAGEGGRNRMGNFYPAHFVRPSAQWLDINRGDYFDYLVSMGNYARETFGPANPYASMNFDMADINNTMIRTKKGRSIHVIKDTISPRPYRHYYTLQATDGIYEHTEKRPHIQGRSPGEWTVQGRRQAPRQWEPIAKYYPEFDRRAAGDLGSQQEPRGGLSRFHERALADAQTPAGYRGRYGRRA